MLVRFAVRPALLAALFLVPARAQEAAQLAAYPGCESFWSMQDENRPYRLAVSRAHKKNFFNPFLSSWEIEKWVDVRGDITRRVYKCERTRALSAIHESYRKALTDSGFEISADGMKRDYTISGDIGSVVWIQAAFAKNPYPDESRVKIAARLTTLGGSAFVAGTRGEPGTRRIAAVAVRQVDEMTILVGIDEIAERGAAPPAAKGPASPAAAAASSPPTPGSAPPAPAASASGPAGTVSGLSPAPPPGPGAITAESISEEIARSGRAVLAGLEFDGARLLPASKPALDAAAKYIQGEIARRFYIVGHAGPGGGLAAGQKLSEARAKAVAKALTEYGIAPSRIEPYGVGLLAPLGPSAASNARIELVPAP